jgi:hypothetical protein
MSSIRAALLLSAVLAAAPAIAAPPGSAKAKRLAPADPPPAAIPVPEEPKAPIAGSCSLPANACADYQGTFAGVDLPALCAKAKGTFGSSACPTSGSVGTCTQRQDGSEDRILTRTYAPGTVDAARKACVSAPRGIFLPAK